MTDLAYRTQTSWFSSHKLGCRLRDGALHCHKGWTRIFAYQDIEEIRVLCFWSRYGAFSAWTTVKGAGMKVTIPSYAEESMGISECRGDTYLPFMEELVARVRAANPDAVFTTGSTALLVFNLAVAALMAALGFFMAGPAELGGWPLFSAFAMAGGLALYAVILGGRREIGADALLEKLRRHVG